MPDYERNTTRPLQEAHVAVLAFPFSTHAGPLLAIIRRLATASPASALFSFFSTHKSNSSLFPATGTAECKNIKAYDVTDGVPEGYVFQGKPQEDIEFFMKAAPDAFRKGMSDAASESGRRVTCIVADAFFWFAEEMAAEMNVPWIAFWTSGPASLASHIYTDIIRDNLDTTKGISGREDEKVQFIPGMSSVRLRDLPEGVLFGNLDSPFSKMLLQMGRAMPRATAVVLNSFEQLDHALNQHLKSIIPQFLCIGPLNLQMKKSREAVPVPDAYGCLPWLDKQKTPASVVYISFGSVVVPPRNELRSIAEALETSRVPFIWSLKESAWHQGLPEGFLEKITATGQGMVVPWSPQTDILSHAATGAFVTHCGWSSLLEAIAGGVPMICRPFFGDQRLNGRTIGDVLDIGVTVDGGVITKEGLLRCIGLVLKEADGRRMRANTERLLHEAEKALTPTGISTENFNKLLEIVI